MRDTSPGSALSAFFPFIGAGSALVLILAIGGVELACVMMSPLTGA